MHSTPNRIGFRVPGGAFHHYALKRQVIEMLYQEKKLGQVWIGARIAAKLAIMLGGKRHADLDLLSMSPHLRRDIGMDNRFADGEIWRK
jgi:hypothetical protein